MAHQPVHLVPGVCPIPWAANRKGKGRQLLNIAIVWLLTSLWHRGQLEFRAVGRTTPYCCCWKDVPAEVAGQGAPVRRARTCFCFVMGWVLSAITDLSALGAYVGAYVLRTLPTAPRRTQAWCDWLLLISGRHRLHEPSQAAGEKRNILSPPCRTDCERVWVVVVLLVSMAFLVGDSYNLFLYFRF